MDRAMSHDEIAGLLGAYALDAVEPDEAGLIEAHLAECPAVRPNWPSTMKWRPSWPMPGATPRSNCGTDRLPSRPSGRTATGSPGARRRSGRCPPPPDLRTSSTGRWSATAAIGAIAAAVIALLALQVGHLDNQVNHGQPVAAPSRRHWQTPGPDGGSGNTTQPRSRLADLVVLPSGSGYVIDNRFRPLASDQTYQLWGMEKGGHLARATRSPPRRRPLQPGK